MQQYKQEVQKQHNEKKNLEKSNDVPMEQVVGLTGSFGKIVKANDGDPDALAHLQAVGIWLVPILEVHIFLSLIVRGSCT